MSGKEELILYKRKKASDLLFDAKLLFENGRYNSAVNRIYYAIFNEVLALLLTKDLASSKHSGVKYLFYENFIKVNLIDKELGRFYSQMFEFRQKSDYGDFITFESDKIKDWIKLADNFILNIEEYINKTN